MESHDSEFHPRAADAIARADVPWAPPPRERDSQPDTSQATGRSALLARAAELLREAGDWVEEPSGAPVWQDVKEAAQLADKLDELRSGPTQVAQERYAAIAAAWVEANTAVRPAGFDPTTEPQYAAAVGVLEFAERFDRPGPLAGASLLERMIARGNRRAAERDLVTDALVELAVAAQNATEKITEKHGPNDVFELEESVRNARIALAQLPRRVKEF